MAPCRGTLTVTMWMTILQHEFHIVKRGVATPPSYPLLTWLPHDFHRSPCPSIPQAYPTQILGSCGSPKFSCCVTSHPTWWPHEGYPLPPEIYMMSTWDLHGKSSCGYHVELSSRAKYREVEGCQDWNLKTFLPAPSHIVMIHYAPCIITHIYMNKSLENMALFLLPSENWNWTHSRLPIAYLTFCKASKPR